MSVVLDAVIVTTAAPPSALVAYGHFHRQWRHDRQADTLARIATLERELEIGRSADEVIAKLERELRPVELPPRDPRLENPYRPGQGETAWRNGVYVTTGVFPSHEQWLASQHHRPRGSEATAPRPEEGSEASRG